MRVHPDVVIAGVVLNRVGGARHIGETRTAIEELGMWGARMQRVGPPVHQRSIRAYAMALQAILVRAGEALPTETHIIELDVDGEYLEIALGPRPTVTARTAVQADARAVASPESLSAYLLGEPVGGETITHTSGDESATRSLIVALGGST